MEGWHVDSNTRLKAHYFKGVLSLCGKVVTLDNIVYHKEYEDRPKCLVCERLLLKEQ